MTAGFALSSRTTAASGRGGFGIRPATTGGWDARSWHAPRRTATHTPRTILGSSPDRSFFWQSVESGSSRSYMRRGAAGGVARTRSHGMTQYLISFDDGAMTFPEEDLPDVAKAALAVAREARDAGVWVFRAGLESQRASIVATDGTVTDGPYPETKEVIGGFAVVDAPSPHAGPGGGGQT